MAEPKDAEREARRARKAARRAEKLQKKREKKLKKHEAQRRLLFPADKKGRHVMHTMNFLRVLLYPLQMIFFPHRLHGHKKVGKGPFIYIVNHYTLWDAFFVAHSTWEGLHFLAKDSVLHAPVIGYFARRLGAIGAMRDGSDVRSLMDCIKVLKNGEKIVIFPEGTRNKTSEETFLPFHGGAAMLAIKTKTPVIPVVLCNRPRLFRVTHVVFGEPMELSEYYGRKLTPEEAGAADKALEARLYALRDDFRAARAEKKAGKKKEKKQAEEKAP